MNQSRVSTNQGVRTLLIQEIFTKKVLFVGEVRRSSGNLIDSSKNFETILFTNNKTILETLSRNDWYLALLREQKENTKKFLNSLQKQIEKRPKTQEK